MAKAGRRYLMMSQFGKLGRFGNQVIELAYMMMYARKHDLWLQMPPWVGDQLFGKKCADMPAVDPKYPMIKELDETPVLEDTVIPNMPPQENVDLWGYFQYHTSVFQGYRDMVRGLFEPLPEVKDRLAGPLAQLRGKDNTVVAMHFRRGDYGRSMFYITPVEWYQAVLEELWPKLRNPVLFIATEDNSLLQHFQEYDPLMTEDLGLKLQDKPFADYAYLKYDLQHPDPKQFDFYPDHYFLQNADYLLMPNSTFSFTAAMLNRVDDGKPQDAKGLNRFWRSTLKDGKMVPFDPWDALPLIFDRVEDFPHLWDQGVKLDSNPYWK